MIKCNICGMEKETRREMNGHLLRCHYDEYKAVNCQQSELTTGNNVAPMLRTKNKKKKATLQRELKSTAKTQQKKDAPAGFRILNRNDEAEAEAYNMGYRYIDDSEMCYDAEEAREKGWI